MQGVLKTIHCFSILLRNSKLSHTRRLSLISWKFSLSTEYFWMPGSIRSSISAERQQRSMFRIAAILKPCRGRGARHRAEWWILNSIQTRITYNRATILFIIVVLTIGKIIKVVVRLKFAENFFFSIAAVLNKIFEIEVENWTNKF